MGVWIETILKGCCKYLSVVTPFVGVWIETLVLLFRVCTRLVTPFVGVWIETASPYCLSVQIRSHPSWVCGLKLCCEIMTDTSYLSHPSWVCGLKQIFSKVGAEPIMSHPSWVCGLKLQILYLIANVRKVTPFVGVWIETIAIRKSKVNMSVTPFVGVWIETCPARARFMPAPSHTLRGCVD